jgi:ATP synthase protein I
MQPDDRSPKATDRLEAQLDAFEAKRARSTTPFTGNALIGQGWTMIIQMIVTVLAGVGLGWLVDRFAHTSPIGLVAGAVIGAGIAVFQAARTAARMGAASLAKTPAQSVPFDDDDD